jgi:hypothetical protein
MTERVLSERGTARPTSLLRVTSEGKKEGRKNGRKERTEGRKQGMK